MTQKCTFSSDDQKFCTELEDFAKILQQQMFISLHMFPQNYSLGHDLYKVIPSYTKTSFESVTRYIYQYQIY